MWPFKKRAPDHHSGFGGERGTPPATTAIACRMCRFPLSVRAKFCVRCGRPVEGERLTSHDEVIAASYHQTHLGDRAMRVPPPTNPWERHRVHG